MGHIFCLMAFLMWLEKCLPHVSSLHTPFSILPATRRLIDSHYQPLSEGSKMLFVLVCSNQKYLRFCQGLGQFDTD